MTKSVVWYGAIQLIKSTSLLDFKGNATTRVAAAGDDLAGFFSYAEALSVAGNVSVADTITGNVSLEADWNLSLSGT